MLTLEEIKRKKQEYGYSNEQLSELSGVPLGTLQKVMGTVTKSPRYETLKALSAVFEKDSADRFEYSRYALPDYVKETPACYGIPRRPIIENVNRYDRQGTYTLEDYLALPEDQRVELIDGVFYDMGSPTAAHQMIAGSVYTAFSNYIKEKRGTCISFIAPTDVQLDCDNRTIVQPDVFVVCERPKINMKRVFGVPDFVLEVLSPSTKNKDMLIKCAKYQNAGVREYWMADPMKKKVFVYLFAGETDMQQYSFEDRIPVQIYDGDLVIDFKEIEEYISFLY